jgi:hypothetical protein
VVTALQFAEDLTDRQAADAVRGRIDWKYCLGLELADAGFDFSVLSEFRGRLVAGSGERLMLDLLLARLKELGLVKAGGRARTDSTHVLARIRDLNRLELAGESVRAALEALAAAEPGWLAGVIDASWQRVYGQRIEEMRLPDSAAKRAELAVQYARDGYWLLERAWSPEAPPAVRDLPAVRALRLILIQQFYRETGPGGEKVTWREDEHSLPPGRARKSRIRSTWAASMGRPGCGTQPRGGRLVQQPGAGRAGHDVADQGAGRQPAHGDRERVAGLYAQRGGVDHDVVAGRIGWPGGHGHRGVAGGEVASELLRPGRGPVGDGQAGRTRPGHSEGDRPPGAARARQQHPPPGQLVAGLTQPDDEAHPVGVRPHQAAVPLAPHDVDSADQRGRAGQLIDVRRQRLLVRHGHAEPSQVTPPVQAPREPAEVAGGHVRGHRHRVDAAPGELGVHHPRSPGVRARVRQVQVHPGSAGDPGGHR